MSASISHGTEADGIFDVSEIHRLLLRHEHRRSANVPTVSVAIGALRDAQPAIEGWAASLGRPLIAIGGAAALSLALKAISDGNPWGLIARAWGLEEGDAGRTAFEWRMFFQSHARRVSEAGGGPFEQALRSWLENRAERSPITVEELARTLDQALPNAVDRWTAIWDLAPADRKPIFVRIGEDPRTLVEIAERRPSAATVWIVEPSGWSELMAREANSRLGAILRETVIGIDAETEERQPPIDEPLESILVRLGGVGHPEAERLRQDARLKSQAAKADDPPSESQARSAAERLLFQCLNLLPETSGQFHLNWKLDCLFGNQLMEIDLAAPELRLAIEIDGYYHFRGPDNYRRDRRKDRELQMRGWFVLRFLADDVALRTQDVLETIVHTIKQRKAVGL